MQTLKPKWCQAGMRLHEIACTLHEITWSQQRPNRFWDLFAGRESWLLQVQAPAFSSIFQLTQQKVILISKKNSITQPSLWDRNLSLVPCALMAFSNYKGTLRCQCSNGWREEIESMMLGRWDISITQTYIYILYILYIYYIYIYYIYIDIICNPSESIIHLYIYISIGIHLYI